MTNKLNPELAVIQAESDDLWARLRSWNPFRKDRGAVSWNKKTRQWEPRKKRGKASRVRRDR